MKMAITNVDMFGNKVVFAEWEKETHCEVWSIYPDPDDYAGVSGYIMSRTLVVNGVEIDTIAGWTFDLYVEAAKNRSYYGEDRIEKYNYLAKQLDEKLAELGLERLIDEELLAAEICE